MEAFENLEVWRRGSRLCVKMYRLLRHCKDYSFRDQLQRSALSIPSNIAEGRERDSDREFARFLKIAKGSCGELRTQLYIGAEIGLIDKQQAELLISETIEIARMLQGLIRRCYQLESGH